MGMALGWMALALAAVGQPDAGRGGAPIEYKVRFVEVEGLGWRDAVFARMTPVTRQGSATVWTAPASVARRLIRDAANDPAAKMLQVPTVTAWSGVPAHVTTRASHQLVTQVSWDGDDGSAASKPETVRTGSAATLSGRRIDQGILVRMALQDTQVLNVHLVKLSGPKVTPMDPAAKKMSFEAPACEGKSGCCADSEKTNATGAPKCAIDTAPVGRFTMALPEAKPIVDDVPYLVEVPEIGSQEIVGEWLIPKDGILLVSFGPHTIAGKDGKAHIRERLAIIEADDAGALVPAQAPRQPIWPTPAMNVPALPARAAMAPAAPPMLAVPAPVAPMPPMPARSIPQGYHKDGKPAELPPLPPDEATSDVDDDGDSAETRPSPQSKKSRPVGEGESGKEKPGPSADAATKKVQYTAPGSFPVIPTLFQPMPTVGLQFLVPIKPVVIRLPFNRRLEIEVYGRVVRAPEPATPSAPTLATTK